MDVIRQVCASVSRVTRMCSCAAPAEAGKHCKLFGPGAACCFGGVFFRAITRVCCLQSMGAMANASRRQQDTMVSKSKYWSAVRLAPGSHPSSELVRTHTCCTPPELRALRELLPNAVHGFHCFRSDLSSRRWCLSPWSS